MYNNNADLKVKIDDVKVLLNVGYCLAEKLGLVDFLIQIEYSISVINLNFGLYPSDKFLQLAVTKGFNGYFYAQLGCDEKDLIFKTCDFEHNQIEINEIIRIWKVKNAKLFN